MFTKNYSIETAISAILGLEDVAIKTPLRFYQVNLPIPEKLESFYYANTGDYMNGYIDALLVDITLKYSCSKIYPWAEKKLGKKNIITKISKNIYENDNLSNIISTIVSSIAVVIEETKGYISTPDIKDIPIGIAGAVTYLGVRYFANKHHHKKQLTANLQNNS